MANSDSEWKTPEQWKINTGQCSWDSSCSPSLTSFCASDCGFIAREKAHVASYLRCDLQPYFPLRWILIWTSIYPLCHLLCTGHLQCQFKYLIKMPKTLRREPGLASIPRENQTSVCLCSTWTGPPAVFSIAVLWNIVIKTDQSSSRFFFSKKESFLNHENLSITYWKLKLSLTVKATDYFLWKDKELGWICRSVLFLLCSRSARIVAVKS